MESPTARELELETTLKERDARLAALAEELERLRASIEQTPLQSEDEPMAVPSDKFADLIPHITNVAQRKPASGFSTLVAALNSKLQSLQAENDELFGLLKVSETGKLKEEVGALRQVVKKLEDSLRESHSIVVNLHAELDQTHEIFASMSGRSLSPILNPPSAPSQSPVNNGKPTPTGPRAGVVQRGPAPQGMKPNKRPRLEGNNGRTNNGSRHNVHISPAMSNVSLPRQQQMHVSAASVNMHPPARHAPLPHLVRDEKLPTGPAARGDRRNDNTKPNAAEDYRPQSSSSPRQAREDRSERQQSQYESREARVPREERRGREERPSDDSENDRQVSLSPEGRRADAAYQERRSGSYDEREERSRDIQDHRQSPKEHRPDRAHSNAREERRTPDRWDERRERSPDFYEVHNRHRRGESRDSRHRSRYLREAVTPPRERSEVLEAQHHRKRPHSPIADREDERVREREKEREKERNRDHAKEKTHDRDRDSDYHTKGKDRERDRGGRDRHSDKHRDTGRAGNGVRRNRPPRGGAAASALNGDESRRLIERMSM